MQFRPQVNGVAFGSMERSRLQGIPAAWIL